MSIQYSDTSKKDFLSKRIEFSDTNDTISELMEKYNNNFSTIIECGGGPAGVEGKEGKQGVPTKPKVPIHVWKKNEDYQSEYTTNDINTPYGIYDYEDLSDVKYQEGHLIVLENGHVYILENNENYDLTPKYKIALQSYNAGDVVDGRSAYMHIAYANEPNSYYGFITDQELRENDDNAEPIATFNLRRSVNSSNVSDMPYMGIYSDNEEASSKDPNRYTWVRVQGKDGAPGTSGENGDKGDKGDKGEKGEQGERGDGYTGQSYTIDLEGDMSTISIDIDRTRLYDASGDYCECRVHAYYGSKNVDLSINEVTVRLPEEYEYLNENQIVLKSDNSNVGQIVKNKKNNDVVIKFIPDENFVFPEKTIYFPIHVVDTIYDENDKNTYTFTRDTVWMIKGIMSTFELEIHPQYKSIKLFEDGKYYPKKLLVDVHKIEDTKRSLFNFNENPDFKLLYKNYDGGDDTWQSYPDEGVDTQSVTCLEFKVVRYYGSTDPEKPEEIWDYEDVWVVADGKSVHYYHADLGAAESMMVLTTGEKITVETKNNGQQDCAELRNESGYSITFEPKFYDGAEELEVVDVNIGTNSDDIYYLNETFVRELGKLETETVDGITKYKSTLTITRVPFNVDMIPMNINVIGKCPDSGVEKSDMVSFNVYISTLSNTYTLVPTKSAYNTSTGKDGDTIGCNVYKNNTLIPFNDLEKNALVLKYIVHDDKPDHKEPKLYTEPLVYGDDSDYIEDEFNAEDVAIEFILEYRGKEIVRSTVPLVKDGIDGRDGDCWQYIFCKSPKYDFSETGISDPSKWTKDPNKDNINSEYLGDKEIDYKDDDPNLLWYDDHQGIDSIFRYEYQSYRKWDKDNKVWGTYGKPTLYSNYSESGSGYSVLLSNPIAVIPVGDDWITNEGNDNQNDSTLVYLYNNTSDISNNPQVDIEIPKSLPESPHFTKGEDENGINIVKFTPVVKNADGEDVYFKFEPNTPYKFPITITYKLGQDLDQDNTVDNFSTTIYWTLSPIKGLEDIEVFVSKRVVNNSIGSEHILKVGYYLISTNNTKQFVGDYNDSRNENRKYEIILTDDIAELIPDESNNVVYVESWDEVEYDFINENGYNRTCYVVLVEPSYNNDGEKEYTIIDYIDVTSVSDGKSSIHLELTQDRIALPSKAEGAGVHDDYNKVITSQMLLYNGDKLIESYDLIQYSFIQDGDYLPENTIEMVKNDGQCDGTFKIQKDIIKGNTNIECIATYNAVSYRKTLFIYLNETPYELEINKSVLTRDMNTGKIIDDNITVNVKCWMDGEWKDIDYGVVKAIANNENTEDIIVANDDNVYDRILTIKGSNLEKNTKDSDIKISYWKEDKELSYEYIGIVNNGVDGNLWQYIYCKLPKYPFKENENDNLYDGKETYPGCDYEYNVSDPSTWRGDYDNTYNIAPTAMKIWFPYHTGVDSVKKYQYQSYRIWDKTEKKWGYYSTPTLYSNYSESGSGYSAMLSNPIAVIPVGDDWRTEEGNDNQYDSTLVYLYDNTSDKSANIIIEIPESPHFTKDTDKNDINIVKFTPVVKNVDGEDVYFEFEPNTSFKLPITIIYNLDVDLDGDGELDRFSTTIDWTLTPIKGLEDVEVSVDRRIVNTSNNSTCNLIVGYYLMSSNNTKQFVGDYNDSRNVNKKYEIILTNSTDNLSHDGDTVIKVNNWKQATYKFTDDNGNNRNCYVVLVEPSHNNGKTVYNVIDYIDVISVSDGKSAIHLELDQDYISLPYNADCTGIHPNYDSYTHPIKSRMRLYNGSVLVDDYNNISYYFEENNKDITNMIDVDPINDGTFTIPKLFIKGDTNIKCIAKYNNLYFYKTLVIDLEKTPYELEINKKILTRNAKEGKIVDDKLIVKVKYWLDGVWYYTNDGYVRLSYNNNQNHEVFTNSNINGHYERTLNISQDNIQSNNTDTEVRISYYIDNKYTKEASYEIIGIIDYSNPTLSSTKRIGFSLNENTDINDDTKWEKSLDNFTNLSPGTPIYVLYEQEWIYNIDGSLKETKRYVIATMSGSQGPEGKSRVLFYLGSFDSRNGKIPTLTGNSVNGKLNDERCDYYIDSDGYAWMRIGEDQETVDGYSNSNSNDINYWKSTEKVGFLQAGAISADMINTGSLVSDSGFVTNLFSLDISATGSITGSTIRSSKVIENSKIATWQINNEGDGWLANENIYWDAQGNLTVKGKIETAEDSKIGIWYTWDDDTISTSTQSDASTKTPMIKFSNDGSGHLCNENIKWDIEGNLTVKGKIETSKDSKIGIWYTWNNGTISTLTESLASKTTPMIKFSNDGSGHLCYKNIEWDMEGNLTVGGINDDKKVTIGNTWEVTSNGIQSINKTAEFNNDGSGQIGGYYKDNKNNNSTIKKGISWNKDGDVTFYDKLITKPTYIILDGAEKEDSHKFIIQSDSSTYVFVEDENIESTNNECNCFSVYLGWFSSVLNDIKLEDGTLCNFTLMNHTNRTIEIYINKNALYLPIKKYRELAIPQHNYTLINNNTFGEYAEIIQMLYILPGSNLELCMEQYNNNTQFYINNISDFRLCYSCSVNGKKSYNTSLVSINYDLNTFNDVGGQHVTLERNELSYTIYTYLRFIFGSSIVSNSVAEGRLEIPYYTQIVHNNDYLNRIYEHMFLQTYSISTVTETLRPPLRYDLNFNPNCNCIEFTGLFDDDKDFNINLIITNTNYKKVRLICYSPLYETIYKGDYVNIVINDKTTVSLPSIHIKSLNSLCSNHKNKILDVLTYFDFSE